jgi:2-methylcitrate dehydratase PrpD
VTVTDLTPTLVQRLGTFAASTELGDLPVGLAGDLPARVLDILGLCVAALDLDTSDAVLGLARDLGGTPSADALGLDTATSAPLAAFVNGVLAHSLDFDDTHLPSIVHPSASVVPAALAVAQSRGRSGSEVLAAIAAGLEITTRLGMAGYAEGTDGEPGQSVYFEHGQHATSICGALGSAAAAARLQGLDGVGCAHAMAVAASMASGIIEANRTGGTVKRIHCGWAAQSGVTAAMLVARGLTGAPTALEGRFGLFEALLRDRWSAGPVVDGLGERWEAAEIFYKPYPFNHFTHGAIDAGLRLAERGVTLERVDRITVSVASATVRTIGEPLEIKRRPLTGYQGQFSGPYAVVAALRGGTGLGLGLADVTDAAVTDPVVVAAMAKVTVVGSEECDAIYPHQFPAVVEVFTTDGETVVEKTLVTRGGPQNPLTDADLATKFRANVAGRLDPDAADRIVAAVAALAEDGDLDAVFAPLRTASHGATVEAGT